jgi:hypothetical protein
LSRFYLTVTFEVQAEKVGPWSSKEVAYDTLRHLIDEGRRSEDIRDWNLVGIEPCLKAPKLEEP